MKQHLLGSWALATGNRCDAILLPPDGTVGRILTLEWSRWPLLEIEKLEYIQRVLPLITQRSQEYLELHGPALVVLGG